jgi:hypothetical protein
MKITGKTLQVTFEHDVTLGHNNSIECTFVHLTYVYEMKDGGIGLDTDFVDVINVKFMGLPIEDGYSGFIKFKKSMKEFGIDVDKMIDEKEKEIVNQEVKNHLKSLFVKDSIHWREVPLR